ncbi:YtxH domain-containing protein [Daejeonella oryzae]|uniref:YtxH domain-containing protein n=1 Tax=Daejeonella oryzae TaxID=1122943 RepID=UPI0004231E1F|nr:YtxH domain-containing protein [Daejeonella oryzae]
MSLFKNLLIGAAVVAGINYITKKRPDGTSLVDEIKDKAPEWMEKAKKFGSEKVDQFNEKKDQFRENKKETFAGNTPVNDSF